MIKLNRKKTVYSEVVLTNSEALQVTSKYLRHIVLGPGRYVDSNGSLKYATDKTDGCEITTDLGPATKVQIAADRLLKALSGIYPM